MIRMERRVLEPIARISLFFAAVLCQPGESQARELVSQDPPAPTVGFLINHMFAAERRQNSYHMHWYTVAGKAGRRGHAMSDADVMIRPFRERLLTRGFFGASITSLELQVGNRLAREEPSGRWVCDTEKPTVPTTGFFTSSWRLWLIGHTHLIGPTWITGEAVWHLWAPLNLAGWQSVGNNVVTSRTDFYVAQTGFTLRRIRSVARVRGPGLRDMHHDGVDWTQYGEAVQVMLPAACGSGS